MIYSAESKTEMTSNEREYVRRPIDTRNNPKCATKI